MKITRIHVLRSSNFNNVTLEAEVNEEEAMAEVYGELVLRCEALLAGKASMASIREERRTLEWAVDSLQREKVKLTLEVEELRRDVKRMGTTVGKPLDPAAA